MPHNFSPKKRTAVTGNPIREEVTVPMRGGALEMLGLEQGVPVVLVLGGSQGAQIINDAVIGALPFLLDRYQIIHQVGMRNIKSIENVLGIVLKDNTHAKRYKPLAFLSDDQMRAASGVADLVVSRAGSTIFEIALWGIPAIIIPITDSNGDHQIKNAYSYTRAGCAEVIEEKNLSPYLLATEIKRIMEDGAKMQEMREAAGRFANPGAAEKIAQQIMNILFEHSGKKR